MYYVLITYVIPYIPYFKLQVHFSLSPTLTNSILPALITFAFRSFLSYGTQLPYTMILLLSE